MRRFRLHLDATRCDGHGICVLACPDLISLDPWGYASTVPVEVEGAAFARHARKAVAMCPAAALWLEATG